MKTIAYASSYSVGRWFESNPTHLSRNASAILGDMKATRAGLILMLAATGAAAQAPVRDAIEREQALSSAQQRAGAAYQEMQQTRHNATRAEQDFLNAQEADRVAQKQAADTKQQLDSAKQALDAARARDAKARNAYDDALDAVDRARKAPAAR